MSSSTAREHSVCFRETCVANKCARTGGGGAEEREEERHREFQWRLEAREGVKWEGCAVAQRRGGRR